MHIQRKIEVFYRLYTFYKVNRFIGYNKRIQDFFVGR